jgi:glucose/arabinose dehydrogenase
MWAMGRAVPPLVVLVLLSACGGGGGDGGRPAASPPAPVSPAGPVRLEEVGQFDEPVHVASPADDERLFVVEKGGLVRVLAGGKVLGEPFLDLSDEVSRGFEQGLLSIAFAPDFKSSGLFYVDYTDRKGDTRVVEFRAEGDGADPASRRELLHVDQPYSNHNGGLLLFDSSGMLIVGLGDGGAGGDPQNRAQDLSELLGKLLRIDPKPAGDRPYGIPEDNPFVGRSGARPEIWAYGLRNPWRFSFEPRSGSLYLADVGQSQQEEVDVVAAEAQPGANFGWPAFEGTSRFKSQRGMDESRLVRPVLTYPTGDGCSVTGGHVVRKGSLAGVYLYGDYCRGEVLGAEISGGTVTRRVTTGLDVSMLSSFGVDASGETYVVSQAGPVFRLVG